MPGTHSQVVKSTAVDTGLGELTSGTAATHALNWGACLRPHHFDFTIGSPVIPRIAGVPVIVCSAVSVVGAGSFKASEDSPPMTFDNGVIIVRAGDRVKAFSFQDFSTRFLLEDGSAITSIFQVDMQTPKK